MASESNFIGPVELTVAQRIAVLFDDDGQCFETADGQTLDAVCRKAMGHRCPTIEGDSTRYVFEDESVIIATGPAWDFGVSTDCMCWAGADYGRHQDDCRQPDLPGVR